MKYIPYVAGLYTRNKVLRFVFSMSYRGWHNGHMLLPVSPGTLFLDYSRHHGIFIIIKLFMLLHTVMYYIIFFYFMSFLLC